MEILDSVACGDQYTTAAQIIDVYNSNGGYFVVQDNDVYAQIQYGNLGQEYFTPEVHVPVGNGILAPKTLGIKFRNYTAGLVAKVSAGLAEGDEPSIILTAGGLSAMSSSLIPPVTIGGDTGAQTALTIAAASPSPDSAIVPRMLISRLLTHSNLAGDFAGDGVASFSTLMAVAQGAESAVMGVQVVGLYGLAANAGSQPPSGGGSISPDACGLYGFGTINNGGTGTPIGLFAAGRREATAPGSGAITAIQATIINNSAATSYSATVVTDCCILINNHTGTQAAAGILVGGEGTALDVGIGFMGAPFSQPVSASIRDDSSSATSIILNGNHSGYGIDMNGGSFTSGAIRLPNNREVVGRNAAGSADVSMFKLNTSNWIEFDCPVNLGDGIDVVTGTATGSKLPFANNMKLGFWGATPVVQQTLSTGVGHTVDDVITFLQTVGLCHN